MKTDISILKLKDGVAFPQDNIVHLIIALSANDNDAHMQLLSDMVDIFMDEDKMNGLLHAECVEDIRRVLDEQSHLSACNQRIYDFSRL